MLAGVDDFTRDDAVVKDFAVVIHVLQKQIEGGDALGQAALDCLPLGACDDARQQVMREDSLGSFFPAVDRECDALIEEREVGFLLSAAKFFGREDS